MCLLYGGRSGEHEISRISAAAIYEHLDRERFDVSAIGISREGVWYRQPTIEVVTDGLPGRGLSLLTAEAETVSVAPGRGLLCEKTILDVDVAFPVLHGPHGEDGTVQGALELALVPFVGSGILASALGMDKDRAKTIWAGAGLPVVPWVLVDTREADDGDTLNRRCAAAWDALVPPLFVKPDRLGSSVGVAKVGSSERLVPAVRAAAGFDPKVLIEQSVDAREIECAVLNDGALRVFPPGEVVPRHEFYSYEAKYIDPEGAALVIPADIPDALRDEMMRVAGEAFRAVDAVGPARVDFLLDRTTGGFYLNEINTMPGFTSISMFPRMVEAGGVSYRDLLTRMVEAAALSR